MNNQKKSDEIKKLLNKSFISVWIDDDGNMGYAYGEHRFTDLAKMKLFTDKLFIDLTEKFFIKIK